MEFEICARDMERLFEIYMKLLDSCFQAKGKESQEIANSLVMAFFKEFDKVAKLLGYEKCGMSKIS